ncbi:divisome protein SepX/GlpR [Streptomyces huiliensis]|uniref:divisome protein SepX/GlpR n=1 Tax=Streptomyces huiliensis TaxID=2876027 RepID=UPI001CBBF92F|nr:hypothetical protein [Streptomyces huiliensis]MBZ4321553.1 hypothetical protein [Streptomyces huiliensis]
MSSSGLIYAVIVGAWAAYLVPMWLRRQDELNEARPTERFSTAIRLLSGRAGMERRYAKELERAGASADAEAPDASAPGAEADAPTARPQEPDAAPAAAVAARPSGMPAPDRTAPDRAAPTPAERARRSKVLARRRRTTVLLFLAFTLGAVVAAVGGIAFLWAPGVPAVLLSSYICYLRVQERRRFAFVMDQRRAELAAQRLREGRPRPQQAADPTTVAAPAPADTVRRPAPAAAAEPEIAPAAASAPSPSAGRRALVEQTDHAEWVDQQRDRGTEGDGWEPVPVPLPTYVTAPVAPRAGASADLGTPDTWSAARSSTAGPTPDRKQADDRRGARPRRRPRERGRTPLFDQYADDERPRAANE